MPKTWQNQKKANENENFKEISNERLKLPQNSVQIKLNFRI